MKFDLRDASICRSGIRAAIHHLYLAGITRYVENPTQPRAQVTTLPRLGTEAFLVETAPGHAVQVGARIAQIRTVAVFVFRERQLGASELKAA